MSGKDFRNALRAPLVTDDSSYGYGIGSRWFYAAKAITYVCADATIGAANWVDEASHKADLWGVGHYLLPPGITLGSDGSSTANFMYCMPISVPHRVQVDRLGIRLTTAQAGGAARVGIYTNDEVTKQPSTLVVDGGAISLASGSGDITATISTWLNPGLYWVASISTATSTMPTIRRVSGGVLGVYPSSDLSELSGGSPWRYLTVAQAYGALPTTAPAMTRSTGSEAPIIGVRRAA